MEGSIYRLLCNTIRGAYVSYDKAMGAADIIEMALGIDHNITYQCLCDHVRGKYCSYDRAEKAASKIYERFVKCMQERGREYINKNTRCMSNRVEMAPTYISNVIINA